jgi:hypothetical protein
LQSTGPGVVLHDGSLGVVLQSIGPGGGSGTLTHSGEVDPCSHVGGGGGGGGAIIVGVGSSIGGGFGSSVVGLLSPPVPSPLLSSSSSAVAASSRRFLGLLGISSHTNSGISFENTCRYQTK